MSENLAGHGQYRISDVQLLNWGAYHGHQRTRVSRKGTAILGPSGRGKSTLLDAMASVILPNPQEFNQAARDDRGGKRERTVYTYARGLTDRRRDENGRTGTTTYLRPPGSPGFASGAAITWTHDDGRQITVLRLAWVSPDATGNDAITASTIYGIIHDHFDLTRLNGIAGTRAGSSPLTRSTLAPFIDESRGDLIDSSQARIHARMRTGMSMGRSEESQRLALDLLRRAQASKGVFNINALFKEFVLTEPEALSRWEVALEAYREAARLYDVFENARQRATALKDLPALAEKYDHAGSNYLAKQRLLRIVDPGDTPRLRLWHAEQICDWVDARADDTKLALAQLDIELSEAVSEHDAAEQQVSDAVTAITAAGGDPTQTLQTQLNAATADLTRIESARGLLEGKLTPLGLALPTDAGDFRLLMDQANTKLTELAHTADQQRETANELVWAAGDLTQRIRRLRAELEGIGNASNIPPEAREFRNRLSQGTGIPLERLRYAGELIDIKPEHRRWEAAVLAVLTSLASDLVVSEADLRTVRTWLNTNPTGTRVSLVAARPGTPTRSAIPGTIPELLVLAPSPHQEWLWHELISRFSYRYVETADELDAALPPGSVGAVTLKGLRTASHGRYTKDDTLAARRYRWIGHDTTRLIDDLTNELEGLQRDAALADAQAKQAQEVHAATLAARQQLTSIVTETRWEQLDRGRISERIATLTARLQEASTPESRSLRHELDRAQKAATAASSRVALLRADHTNLDTAFARLADLKDQEVTLLDTHPPLTAVERDAVTDLGFLAPTRTGAIRDVSDLAAVVADSYRTAVTDLTKQITNHAERRDQYETTILTTMRLYRAIDDQTARHIDEHIDSLPTLLAIHAQLIADDLPRAKARWLEQAGQDMNNQLRGLLVQIEDDRRSIHRGLEPINRVLRTVAFRQDSTLTIDPVEKPSPELHALRQTIATHTSNTLGLLATDEATMEKGFLALRTDLAKLDDLSRAGDSWRRRVFDAREHLEFHAIETRADGVLVVHDGVSGMSGGEGQELIAFILGAALRYRLGEGSDSTPTYASVILDEGFVKADSDYTGRALSALSALGFQIIIGAPREKATAFEHHVESVAYISTDPANPAGVHIYEMTIHDALNLSTDPTTELHSPQPVSTGQDAA